MFFIGLGSRGGSIMANAPSFCTGPQRAGRRARRSGCRNCRLDRRSNWPLRGFDFLRVCILIGRVLEEHVLLDISGSLLVGITRVVSLSTATAGTREKHAWLNGRTSQWSNVGSNGWFHEIRASSQQAQVVAVVIIVFTIMNIILEPAENFPAPTTTR